MHTSSLDQVPSIKKLRKETTIINLISYYTHGEIEEQEKAQEKISEYIQSLPKFERIIIGQDSNAQIGLSAWSDDNEPSDKHIGTHTYLYNTRIPENAPPHLHTNTDMHINIL